MSNHILEQKSIKDLLEIYNKSLQSLESNSHNKNIEFEIRFDERKIDKLVFENIYKKLHQCHFNNKISEYILKIFSENSENIRVEINNIKDIQKYCKTNLLNELNNKIFLKKINIDSLQKPNKNIDYGFRTSIQTEIMYNDSDRQIHSLLSNWQKNRKLFRYMHRISLVSELFPNIRIDLSKVCQSKEKKINFNETSIFNTIDNQNNDYNYEVEIEIINIDKTNFDANLIENQLKKVIKFILCGIQDTIFPTSFKELFQCKEYYMNLFNLDPKNKKTQNFIGPSSVSLHKINLIDDDSLDNICVNKNNFCVTDKADGQRKLLMVMNNKLYFITQNLQIQYTGTRIKDGIMNQIFIIDGEHIKYNKHKEFINLYAAFDIYYFKSEGDTDESKDIRKFPFYNQSNLKKSRYPILKTLINKLNENEHLIHDSINNILNLSYKMFYMSDEENNIFKKCNSLIDTIYYSDKYPYETDGIIFTSKDLGVTQEHSKDSIKNKKYSWQHSFKWKPPEFNTIDFLIEIKKDDLNNPIEYLKNNDGNIMKYYEIHLYTGFDESKHGYLNSQKLLLENNFIKNKEINSSLYRPEKFYPTNPYDKTAHICHIKVDYNLNMFTEEKQLIQDKMIVEFKYIHNEDDKFLSWVPIRVRYDKMSESKNYGNAYHVANLTWQSIHEPITKSMLRGEEEITIKKLENIDTENYYNRKTKNTKKTQSLRNFHNLYVKDLLFHYCKKQYPNETTMLDLAVGKGGDIPRYMKYELNTLGIDINQDNIHNIKDGACVRYITEYNRSYSKKKSFCMFINGDVSKFLFNGNFEKINENENEYENNNDENNDDENIISDYIFKSLNGSIKREDIDIKHRYLLKNYGIFSNKFDICSIQFALHYMFENEKKLNHFIKNIADYTKIGGYFIGTCYDGELVYNKLKDKDSYQIYSSDTKLCEIKKKYIDETDSFLNNERDSIGYQISVYQESINKEIDEYLVNFNYLEKIMNDYGFVLEGDDTKMIEHPLNPEVKIKSSDNFEILFNEMNKDKTKYGDAKNMNAKEKEISFLNRYFIFKKVRNVSRYIYDFQTNQFETINYVINKAIKTNKKIILSK